MPNNTMRFISSLVECAQKEEQGYLPEKTHPVITLSAGTGAGGKEVGRILAKRLGVDLYDEKIVELLAREAHLDQSILKRLDERLDGFRGAWLYSILAGENLSSENYLRNLTRVIRGIASCKGGVILGRGGSFILLDLPVLRVHITGTLDRCIDRLVRQEGILPRAAKQKIEETDKARRDYLKKLFKCDYGDDPAHFDLVINSDHLAATHIADLILRAKKCAKFG